jgi:fucose permease
LSVFFLSGLLMCFPGAVLPSWGHHISEDFLTIGAYFFALGAGLVTSVKVSGILLKKKDVQFVVVSGCGLASASLLYLAAVSPPLEWGWRVAGMFALGLSAGMLNRSAFQSLTLTWERDAASTVNLAGITYGLGSLLMALFLSGTFYVYTGRSSLILAALSPGFAAGIFARRRFGAPVAHKETSPGEMWRDIRSPAAVLFSLLLFFQFCNEWTVAGWLTVFAVHRAGVAPDDALQMLAVFWASLLVGRVGSQVLLKHFGHGKLLITSAAAAMLGCLLLMATDNSGGAWVGVLMLGAGSALIYPLVVEKIGHRFPDYHPGFFNGIFSLAVAGGLVAPVTVAIGSHFWGVWVVMALPMAGTVLVFLLTLAIWLEARLAGGKR